jgi:hypothetical protein
MTEIRKSMAGSRIVPSEKSAPSDRNASLRQLESLLPG